MPTPNLALPDHLRQLGRALLGPLVTATAVLGYEAVTPTLGVELSAPAVMLTAVVFATFVSGLPGGLVSAGIATAYYFDLVLLGGPDQQWRFIQLTLTTFLLAGLVHGLLHYAVERQRLETDRAERALARTERNFRLIADNTSDVVYAAAMDGSLIYVNPAFEKSTGYPTRALAGRCIAHFTHPDDAERVRRLCLEARQGRSMPWAEFRIITRAGQTRWLGGNWGPLRDDAGEQIGIQARHWDRTEQKRAEQQLVALNQTLEQRVAERTAQLRSAAAELNQAEQRERRRLARVLHDHLQQLLVAARLRVSLLRGRGDADELNELDDLLVQSIDASRSLTAELSPPLLRDTRLSAAMQWLARAMHEKHGLAVEVLTADEPASDRLSEDMRAFLVQTVRELLFNTVKHAGVDHARVVLEMPRADALAIRVEDDGAGFDPGQLHQGREHFGLLSIVHRLELLGGHMDIDAHPGQGTRITVRTPLSPAASNRAPAAA